MHENNTINYVAYSFLVQQKMSVLFQHSFSTNFPCTCWHENKADWGSGATSSTFLVCWLSTGILHCLIIKSFGHMTLCSSTNCTSSAYGNPSAWPTSSRKICKWLMTKVEPVLLDHEMRVWHSHNVQQKVEGVGTVVQESCAGCGLECGSGVWLSKQWLC